MRSSFLVGSCFVSVFFAVVFMACCSSFLVFHDVLLGCLLMGSRYAFLLVRINLFGMRRIGFRLGVIIISFSWKTKRYTDYLYSIYMVTGSR